MAATMKERGGGRIVNISSAAARYRVATEVTSAAYVAAKGAVLGLTRQTGKLLAPDGITVNAVLPGDVLTEAGTELLDSLSEADRKGVLSRIPRGTMTTPDEVGAAVLSLCRQSAGAIIGVSLDVNGGAWMQ
jgi:NAD(P)-dependent dehydrogenase (short-subunit alcohol dehydrogenase family)